MGVRWELPDGRLAQVISFGRLTEQEVLRFARGLRDGAVVAVVAVVAEPPVTIAAVPPGLIMDFLADGKMCFGPPPLAEADRYEDGLCAGVEDGTVEPERGDQQRTIAGRPAVIDAEGSSTRVPLGGTRSLFVRALEQSDVPISRKDLIRFAEGVREAGQ